MKILPVGEQVFAKIRERDFLYVDKTRYIYELLQGGTYFFLSRPRRFGKTLLIDTMKTLFEGKREYFKGLWIDEHYDWTKTYPVIRIGFNHPYFREKPLPEALNAYIDREATRHNVVLKEETPGAKLSELVEMLYTEDRKVVLLIDEYDKTMTDYLEELPRARANRDTLKAFYSPLKDLDDYLHFVFVTGVSKYGKVSIFSDLNNLDDLTLSPLYAPMLGYTQEELEEQMAPNLAYAAERLGMEYGAFLTKMRLYYNGYTWDGEHKVYNPFSVNKFLKHTRWGNHWYSTGTPTMLVTMLSQQKRLPQSLEDEWGAESLMEKLSLDAPPSELTALLWQTGYLTIKEIDDSGRGAAYLLGFPNWEVKDAFLLHVWHHYANLAKAVPPDNRLTLASRALKAGDLATFFTHFESLMATIPYQLFIGQEGYYHALVYLFMELSGLKPISEASVAGGRIDTVLETEDTFYVFEFKIKASAQEALQQIEARDYAKAYMHQGKKVVAVGVSFDAETRGLAEWKQAEVLP